MEYVITLEHGETVTETPQMGQLMLRLCDDGTTAASLGRIWSRQVEQGFGGDDSQALPQAEVDGNGFSYYNLIEAGEACTVPSGLTELGSSPCEMAPAAALWICWR